MNLYFLYFYLLICFYLDMTTIFFCSKYLYFNNYFCIDSSVFLLDFELFFFFFNKYIIGIFLINNKHSIVEFPLLILLSSYILVISTAIIDVFSMLIVLESISFLIIGLSIMSFFKNKYWSSFKIFCTKYFSNWFISFWYFWNLF